ncbi:GntR family transcriptional regulator [Caulobacter sp. X]|uniref:GntR family transcriptional regulator n=1 Tax=Caulobacter sp. X TaxID=2048901 RepID=UPI000C14D55E|nr:GntR family transcriptional regulator [Caulobacter sp. X]PIB95236.1 GntR family transcriptional regulator [Caulobacter sp. X]
MQQTTVLAVKEQIAERLRSEIISGELAPNQKLTEIELAERFGVSRGRIRDVLFELSKEGLLVLRANKGTSVADVAPPDVQALLIKLRLSIETFAVRQAIKRPGEELEKSFKRALADLAQSFQSGNFAEVTKADIACHRSIVRAGGGEDLVNLWQPVIMRMRMNYQRITTPEESIAEHEAIYNAILAGDEDAAIAALQANVR